MNKLTVNVRPPYDILLDRGLLRQAGLLAAGLETGRRVMIVSDETVAALYLEKTRAAFAEAGFDAASFVFPAGEAHKRLSTVEALLDAADAAGLTRTDLFAALGGGLVGDLTGLAAALYLRGVGFIQLPTTLLAMADAAVGGKTAVNLASGKNLCGVFHQPRLVLCDLDTLDTLPPAVFAEGMAEVIKYGAICSAPLLDKIRNSVSLEDILSDCLRIKGEIVREDTRDRGRRQLLNLGHTFGHALEKLSDYTLYHGEGVSVGLLIAAWAAEKHGLCASGVYDELRALLCAQRLPVTTPFQAVQVASCAMNDKKRRGDTLTLVLPKARGESRLYPLPAACLGDFIACCDGEVTGC